MLTGGNIVFELEAHAKKSVVLCQKGASRKILFEILYFRGSCGPLYTVRMLEQRVLLLVLLWILFVGHICLMSYFDI